LGVVEVAPLLKCLAGEVKKRSAVYKQLAIDSRTVGKMLPLVVVWPRRLGIAPWQEELLKLMEWSILVMLPSVLEGVGRFDCRLGLVEKFHPLVASLVLGSHLKPLNSPHPVEVRFDEFLRELLHSAAVLALWQVEPAVCVIWEASVSFQRAHHQVNAYIRPVYPIPEYF